MPDNNLAVGISVDAAKARADLKLFNAEIANTTKALRDAVKAGDTAAQTAQHQTLIGLYQKTAEAQVKVTAAKKADTAATREATQAHRGYTASLREGAFEFGHLAHAAGLPIEGLKALRAGFIALAGVEVIRALQAVTEEITKIIRLSKETGASTSTLQTFQRALESTGGEAQDADNAIKSLSDRFNEARKAALEAGQTFGSVGVFRGGTGQVAGDLNNLGSVATRVFHGASEATIDFSKSLEQLVGPIRRFGSGEAEFDRFLLTIAQRLVAINKAGRIDEANQRSVALFGQNYRQLGAALEEVVKSGSLDALREALGVKVFTPEEKARTVEYTKALRDLGRAWSELVRSVIMPALPYVTRFLQLFTPMAGRIIAITASLVGMVLAWRGLVAILIRVGPLFTGLVAGAGALRLVMVSLGAVIGWPALLIAGIGTLLGTLAVFGNQSSKNASGFASSWSNAFDFIIQKIRELIRWLLGLDKAATDAAGAAAGVGAGAGAGGAASTPIPGTSSYQAAPFQGFVGGQAVSGSTATGSGIPGTSSYSAAPPQRVSGSGLPTGAFTIEEQRASGGYIRGRGTGTSDSILARLSNGEFVMNAGSVRRLGVGFLQGLNNFASGGLVNVPPIRFASGGLVPAFAGGGQAMASFHFESGNSFKLGGPVDVVNAMVTEAHAQQTRSAGVKPSWFASRPSGR